MSHKGLLRKSLDFWVISLIVVFTLLYIFVSEMAPTDWFISSKKYQQNNFFSYQNFTRKAFVARDFCHFRYESYIQEPETLFEQIDYLFLDDPKVKKVVLASIQGRHYVVTKYKCPNIWTWLKRFPLRSSDAFRAWHFANRLTQIGVPTARPILMVEKRLGPFWTMSYCVHEYIEGVRASDYFGALSSYKEQWPETVESLKEHLNALKKAQMIHTNISLTNTLIANNKPYFLDLERIHQYHRKHALFEKRCEYQHIERLERKLNQLNQEPAFLYKKTFELNEET